MTRRDWWVGIAIIVAAVTLPRVVPRHTFTHVSGDDWIRTDRWTGDVELWEADSIIGEMIPLSLRHRPARREGEGFDPVWHALGWNHDEDGWYWRWYTKRTGTFSAADIDYDKRGNDGPAIPPAR